MNLTDTLFVIENFLGIEADSLLPFAEQDTIGGYNPDPSQSKWHIGSMFGVEGQILHALIRSLRPASVVEIGSGLGCSGNHIASALKANGKGHLTTMDRGNTPIIADDLQSYVTALAGDAFGFLDLLPDNSVDFMFEDADHTEDMCYRVGIIAQQKLAPGGVLVAHDAAHYAVGADVRSGFARAGIEGRVYLTEPSDCGLLVWRKAVPVNLYLPKDYVAVEAKRPYITQMEYTEDGGMTWKQVQTLADTEPALQAQEDKPKRKPARKAVK